MTRWFKKIKKQLIFAFVISSMISCSPTAFFEDGEDSRVLSQKNYRTIPIECSGLSLSSLHMNEEIARKIARCFNGHGQYKEFESWINELSSQEISWILDLFNKSVFENPQVLFELDQTLDQLVDLKKNKEFFKVNSEVFRSSALFFSQFDLLREMIFKNDGSVDPSWASFTQFWLVELKEDGINDFLSFFYSIFQSPAMRSLKQSSLKKIESQYSIKQMASDLLEYLSNEEGYDPIEGLLRSVASGEWFWFLDQWIGKDPDDIRNHLYPALVPFFSLLENNGKQLKSHSALIGLFDSDLSCANGAFFLEKPVYSGIHELALSSDPRDLLLRKLPVEIQTLGSFCEIPKRLGSFYPDVANFVMKPGFIELYKSLKIIDQSSQRHLIRVLVDGVSSNQPVFFKLVPTLVEIFNREQFEDILLLITSLKSAQRKQLEEFAEKLLKKIPGQNISSYELIKMSLKRVSLKSWMNVFQGYRNWIYDGFETKDILNEFYFLKRLNSAHPVVYFINNFFKKIKKNPESLSILFSSFEKESFKIYFKSLERDLNNGNFEKIIRSFLFLTRKYAKQGQGLLLKNRDSKIKVENWLTHQWSKVDLNKTQNDLWMNSLDAACTSVYEFNFFIDSWKDDLKSQKSLDDLIRCSSLKEQDSVDVFLRLLTKRDVYYDNGVLYRNKPFHQWVVDLVKTLEFQLNSSEINLFINELTDVDSLYYFKSFLNDLNFYLKNEFWIPLFFKIIEPMKEKKIEIQKVFSSFSSDFVSQEFSGFVYGLRRIFSFTFNFEKEEVKPKKTKVRIKDDVVKKWIHKHEWIEEENLDERVSQVKKEYFYSINNGDYDWREDRRPLSWDKSLFFEEAKRVISKFENKNLVDRVFQFMNYYSKSKRSNGNSQKSHYFKDELYEWLRDRSRDVKVITYYHPDPTGFHLKTRLVSTLDQFEILLFNADMQVINQRYMKNFALHFLGMIAEAWGDEKRENWPPEIQEKYRNITPMTLSEAVLEIKHQLSKFEKILGVENIRQGKLFGRPYQRKYARRKAKGLVTLREAKKRLFNIRKVFTAIENNLPSSGHKQAGGLVVLRDLFFQIYYSEPAYLRHPKLGERHPLSLVIQMVHLGLLRQITRQFQYFEKEDQNLRVWFRNFVELTQIDGVSNFIQKLSSIDKEKSFEDKILYRVVKGLFEWVDSSSVEDQSKLTRFVFESIPFLNSLVFSKHQTASFLNHLGKIVETHRSWIFSEVSKIPNLNLNHLPLQSLIAWNAFDEISLKRDIGRWLVFKGSKIEPLKSGAVIVRSIFENKTARSALFEFSEKWSESQFWEQKPLWTAPILDRLERYEDCAVSSSSGCTFKKGLKGVLESPLAAELLIDAAYNPYKFNQILLDLVYYKEPLMEIFYRVNRFIH